MARDLSVPRSTVQRDLQAAAPSRLQAGANLALRAGGALAVLAVVYFYSPARWATDTACLSGATVKQSTQGANSPTIARLRQHAPRWGVVAVRVAIPLLLAGLVGVVPGGAIVLTLGTEQTTGGR